MIEGRPDVLTKEWIDEDRVIRFEVLRHAGDSLSDEVVYRQVVVTFLIAICNELQYLNDFNDVVSGGR